MNSIEMTVSTIEKHGLISKNDKILVGLSGGADSVSLLHILHSLSGMYGITVYAAHINHNMRPTAERDMEYSRLLCKRLGIEFFCHSADVSGFAEKNGLSSEEAGRRIRYDFFDKVCRENKIDKTATAHNLNDNAETIFMNFIRGSGTSGLKGIPYRRGNIIRPILDLTREQTEEYCRANSLEFMTDETNRERLYTRNKIRLDLIPYIEKNINENFIRRIAGNSDIISDEDDFMDEIAGDVFNKVFSREKDRCGNNVFILDTSKLVSCRKAVLRRVFLIYFCKIYDTDKHMERRFIDSAIMLMNGQSGRSLDLPGNIVLSNEYGTLRAYINKSSEFNMPEIVKTYNVPAGKTSAENIFIRPEFADTLSVRAKKDGDYFYPEGMEGRKKLKKLFSDLKIPVSKRSAVPIVVSGDEIVWIAGIRADRRFVALPGEISVKLEIRYN
ncbi:MAG: tRNA lysidine(34) synthetase TilS [Oscillospiraceae bacterium]|nr:tRNA lysidine(34) synthetase TilS [Oscillospiraceae bacterium]